MNTRFALAASVLSLCTLAACGDDTSGTGGGGTGASGTGGEVGSGGSGGASCTPTANPAEICDGVDNDCDGAIDDLSPACGCVLGDTESCYSGPTGTEGIGVCVAGSRSCQPDGTFGACEGEVVPGAETCNAADDDCNGLTDDLPAINCGVGACSAVSPACVNGQPATCTPGMPVVEVCDGIDNDCDTETDEDAVDVGADCQDPNSLGACIDGTTVCGNGALSCAPSLPTDEVCDEIDNDCDGDTDEEVPTVGDACDTSQLGVCAMGSLVCANSAIECVPMAMPMPETCNGLDDDCDGDIDDGNPGGGSFCMTGLVGVCAAGVTACSNGSVSCTQLNQPSVEVCNGMDDDCNGTLDDGNPGGGAACGCGGVETCSSGSLVCAGSAAVYLDEDFSDNAAGWTLASNWQIGPAVAGCGDPATDHTPTADNGVAGVVIGGCAPTALTPDLCLTSPAVNTSAAPAVFLSFWRELWSDYTPYMKNRVEVFNGTAWTTIWETFGSPGVDDATWTSQSFDITAYKAANMRVRFCYNIGSAGVFNRGSWSLDDVRISGASCP